MAKRRRFAWRWEDRRRFSKYEMLLVDKVYRAAGSQALRDTYLESDDKGDEMLSRAIDFATPGRKDLEEFLKAKWHEETKSQAGFQKEIDAYRAEAKAKMRAEVEAELKAEKGKKK